MSHIYKEEIMANISNSIHLIFAIVPRICICGIDPSWEYNAIELMADGWVIHTSHMVEGCSQPLQICYHENRFGGGRLNIKTMTGSNYSAFLFGREVEAAAEIRDSLFVNGH